MRELFIRYQINDREKVFNLTTLLSIEIFEVEDAQKVKSQDLLLLEVESVLGLPSDSFSNKIPAQSQTLPFTLQYSWVWDCRSWDLLTNSHQMNEGYLLMFQRYEEQKEKKRLSAGTIPKKYLFIPALFYVWYIDGIGKLYFISLKSSRFL